MYSKNASLSFARCKDLKTKQDHYFQKQNIQKVVTKGSTATF